MIKRLFSFFVFYVVFAGSAFAAVSIFDPDVDYTICYRLSERDFSILEGKIAGINEVAQKSVLILDRKNFSARDDKGFIMMDSVIVILPTDQARAQGNSFCKNK